MKKERLSAKVVNATRCHGVAADDVVTQLLRDAERTGVSFDRTGARALRIKATERKLEHRRPHLGTHALALEVATEPRPGAHGPRFREPRAFESLHADELAFEPDPWLEMPGLRAPLPPPHLVVVEEPRELWIVRPRNRERHELRWMDSAECHLAQRHELISRRQAEL